MDASGKPSAWQEVDAAVLKLGADPGSVSGYEVQEVTRWLRGGLRKRFADFAEADLEDVCQEALMRFVRSVRDGIEG